MSSLILQLFTVHNIVGYDISDLQNNNNLMDPGGGGTKAGVSNATTVCTRKL